MTTTLAQRNETDAGVADSGPTQILEPERAGLRAWAGLVAAAAGSAAVVLAAAHHGADATAGAAGAGTSVGGAAPAAAGRRDAVAALGVQSCGEGHLRCLEVTDVQQLPREHSPGRLRCCVRSPACCPACLLGRAGRRRTCRCGEEVRA